MLDYRFANKLTKMTLHTYTQSQQIVIKSHTRTVV